MREKIIKHSSYILPVASTAGLLLFWKSTNPQTVGPVGILCVFALIYVVCVATLFAALRALRALMIRIKFGKTPMSTRKLYYVSTISALGPVLVLTMVGVGSLTVWSVALIAVFLGLALFYILRAT